MAPRLPRGAPRRTTRVAAAKASKRPVVGAPVLTKEQERQRTRRERVTALYRAETLWDHYFRHLAVYPHTRVPDSADARRMLAVVRTLRAVLVAYARDDNGGLEKLGKVSRQYLLDSVRKLHSEGKPWMVRIETDTGEGPLSHLHPISDVVVEESRSSRIGGRSGALQILANTIAWHMAEGATVEELAETFAMLAFMSLGYELAKLKLRPPVVPATTDDDRETMISLVAQFRRIAGREKYQERAGKRSWPTSRDGRQNLAFRLIAAGLKVVGVVHAESWLDFRRKG